MLRPTIILTSAKGEAAELIKIWIMIALNNHDYNSDIIIRVTIRMKKRKKKMEKQQKRSCSEIANKEIKNTEVE